MTSICYSIDFSDVVRSDVITTSEIHYYTKTVTVNLNLSEKFFLYSKFLIWMRRRLFYEVSIGMSRLIKNVLIVLRERN